MLVKNLKFFGTCCSIKQASIYRSQSRTSTRGLRLARAHTILFHALPQSIPAGSQPAKTAVSPRSLPLGAFRQDRRLRLSDRNSILMTQVNVCIIIPVVMEFQAQICPILGLSRSVFVKFVFVCERAPAKLKFLFQRRVYSTNIDCFVIDLQLFHLTFVAFCLSILNNS